jgi:hypothetical protein
MDRLDQRPTRRRLIAAAAALTLITAAALDPAAAHADDSGEICVKLTSGSLGFAPTNVTLGGSATLTWSSFIPCGSIRISLSGPPAVGGDEPSFQAVDPSGSMSVTPQRTAVWSLVATDNDGGTSATLATATVAVAAPVNLPPTGGPAFTITGGDQVDLLVQAVGTANATVTVAPDVVMDLTGRPDIHVAPGVSLLGQYRAWPKGPRLLTRATGQAMFVIGEADAPSDNVRISGLWLDGGTQTEHVPDTSSSNGILVQSSLRVEIDHNAIEGWGNAAIEVRDAANRISIANASTVHVHDNGIRYNLHPSSGGHAAGYGVEVSHGGYALIERNVFDFNRHSIAGDGLPGTGYLAYRNLIEPNGGKHLDLYFTITHTHTLDMHGLEDCDVGFLPFSIPADCGAAGEYVDIEYNTIRYTDGVAVKMRGVQSLRADVAHNVFAHQDVWGTEEGQLTSPAALIQTDGSDLDQWDNRFGLDVEANLGSLPQCDIDGDGKLDRVIGEGTTWWYFSSLRQDTVYLTTSRRMGEQLSVGDVTGDGRCDVTVGGTVFSGGEPIAHSDLLWTDQSGDSSLWQMTGPSVGAINTPGNLSGLLGTADVDGDGDRDVLRRDAGGVVRIVHLEDGKALTGTVDLPRGPDGAPAEPQFAGRAADPDGRLWAYGGAGDLDADGFDDVVWRRPDGHLEVWFRGQSIAALPVPANAMDARWQVAGVADFNADGRADVLLRSVNGAIQVWYMFGEQRIGAAPVAAQDPGTVLAGIGDFDADGAADILWREASGTLTLWNKGAPAGAGHPSYQNAGGNAGPEWQILAVSDFTGDGRADILWRHGPVADATAGPNQLVIWAMRGATYAGTIAPAVAGASWSLAGALPVRGVRPTRPVPEFPRNRESTVGLPAHLTLSAVGGAAPYTWTATGLPAGVTLGADGHASGSPVAAGAPVYTVTATATDLNGQTGSTTFTWTIDGLMPVVAGLPWGTAAARIRDGGLAVGPVVDTITCEQAVGSVVDTSLVPGTVHPMGTPVKLYVAKRPTGRDVCP